MGIGSRDCETRWSIESKDQKMILSIFGKDGVTCVLTLDDDMVFRGRWERHEKMPIELIPEDVSAFQANIYPVIEKMTG